MHARPTSWQHTVVPASLLSARHARPEQHADMPGVHGVATRVHETDSQRFVVLLHRRPELHAPLQHAMLTAPQFEPGLQ